MVPRSRGAGKVSEIHGRAKLRGAIPQDLAVPERANYDVLTMRVATGWLAALLLGACSCAGGSDAMQKELSDIRSELVKLRAQNAILTDRLDSIETIARRPPAPRPAPPAEDSDRPSLEVVRLGPETPASAPANAGKPRPGAEPQAQDGAPAEPAADSSAGGSRPVIRLTGKASPGPQPAVKKNPVQAKP
jgi:hypothetical protein